METVRHRPKVPTRNVGLERTDAHVGTRTVFIPSIYSEFTPVMRVEASCNNYMLWVLKEQTI